MFQTGRPDHHLAPLREQLLSEDSVAPAHVVQQLVQLAPERTHDANAGKRFANPTVDQLRILAQ